jgi:hypothetical protein
MSFSSHLACAAFLSCALLAPLQAEELPAAERQRIEEMVTRCNGDKTCEQVVRKRETAAAEKRRQRALLKQNDPHAYYLQLWGRYLAFVLAIGGGALLYITLMRRLFGRKK